MNEIYLKIDAASKRVILIHYNPFDENNGLTILGESISETRTRLLNNGVFVTVIPDPQYSTSEYRAVLKYDTTVTGYVVSDPNTGCVYDYIAVPPGDSILLNTLENLINDIKTIIPTSKLLTVTADTVDKSNFNISELFASNPNYGIAVNKNGTYLKNNLDYSIIKSSGIYTLTIFSGIDTNDYVIVIACDNLSEHTHNLSSVNGLIAELNNKSAILHNHTINDVTGLSSSLQGLTPLSHVGAIGNAHGLVTDQTPGFMSNTDKIKLDELESLNNILTSLVPASHAGATGNAHGVATGYTNGFMSLEDKIKLDELTIANVPIRFASNVTTHTLTAGDNNKRLIFTSSQSCKIILPNVGLPAGFNCVVRNVGGGALYAEKVDPAVIENLTANWTDPVSYGNIMLEAITPVYSYFIMDI